MSETPSRPTERLRMSDRQVSLPLSLVTTLMGTALAGGGGSYLTGSAIAQEFREFRITMEAKLDAIQRDAARTGADHAAAINRIEREAGERERRLREIELWRAREDARAERDRGIAPR